MRWLEETHAVPRMLNDEHGIMVLPTHPEPRFESQEVAAVVGKPSARVAATLAAARSLGARFSDREVLAYDLFGASFFQPSADARFLMLMMALETLVEQQPRPDEARAVIRQLGQTVTASSLPPGDRDSLAGALKALEQESSRQAGRRAASTLGGRKYMDMSARAFFEECYHIRSALVHGHYPRPSREQVDVLAAHLEGFVGDLLSGLAHLVDD